MSEIIWTKPTFKVLLKKNSEEVVENYFEDKYGKFCVLFSSVRAGLVAVLSQIGLNRSKNIYIPPFLSHCVLNAVGQVANPISIPEDASAVLLNHQWGYKNKVIGEFKNIIEDSCDSFIVDGDDLLEFGDYELVSLPKTFGAFSGGVVFCRTLEEKERLIEARNDKLNLLYLKLLGKFSSRALSFWSSLEPLGGKISPLFISDIFEKIQRADEFKDIRLEYISILKQKFYRRLPSCLVFESSGTNVNTLDENGIKYERLSQVVIEEFGWRSESKLLFPIHQEVDRCEVKKLQKVIDELI